MRTLAVRALCSLVSVVSVGCGLDTFGISAGNGTSSSAASGSTMYEAPTTAGVTTSTGGPPLSSGESGVMTATSDPVCGDGLQDDGEGCDDGNRAPGDGCSDACQTEPGATLWELFVVGPGDGEGQLWAEDIQILPTDGSVVVVGQISVGAPLQAGWVARYTAEGTLVWSKDDIYPDASVATTAKGLALRVTNGVEILVGGRALTTDWTAWIRGYRDDGSFGSFAEFTYGGPGNTTLTSNGFVLAANSDLFMGGESGGIWVGKFPWDPIAKAWGTDWQLFPAPQVDPERSRVGGLAIAADGHLLACGYLGALDGTPVLGEPWLLKLRSDTGMQVWDRSSTLALGAQYSRCNAISVDEQGAILVGGALGDGTQASERGWVHRLDADGFGLWGSPVLVDGPGQSSVSDLAVGPDDTIAVAAVLRTTDGDLDAQVFKLAGTPEKPTTSWSRTFTNPDHDDLVNAVAIDVDGAIAAGGRMNGEIWVVKLSP